MTTTSPTPDRVTLTRDQLAALLAHHADVLAARWRAVAPGAGAWEVAAALSLTSHAMELTADVERPAVAELLDSMLTFPVEQPPAAPPVDRAGLRDCIAAAIWEQQNPGRRWADCEYRWRADAEEDADAVLAVLPQLAAPDGLRARIADVLADADGHRWVPGYDRRRSPAYQQYQARADKVLAALPTTDQAAARAAALREVADFYERVLEQSLNLSSDPRYYTAVRDVVMGLRRRADDETRQSVPAEAQQQAADRAAVLTDTERQFLTHALDLAQDEMHSRPDEFGPDDEAALERLRRMAAVAPQPETQAGAPASSTPPCALCDHPKRDHDGRTDHRAKYSPLVAGDPWCHACNAECDYAEQPAVVSQPGKDTTTTQQQQPADRAAVEPVCVCGHPIGLHHEDVCLRADCGCADSLETGALPEALEAVLTERYTELGNPFSEMRRREQGPDGWPASRPVGPHHVAEALRELLRRAADDGSGLRLPDHTVNEAEAPDAGARQDGPLRPAPRDRHRAAWDALTPQQQAAYLTQLNDDETQQDGEQQEAGRG